MKKKTPIHEQCANMKSFIHQVQHLHDENGFHPVAVVLVNEGQMMFVTNEEMDSDPLLMRLNAVVQEFSNGEDPEITIVPPTEGEKKPS